MSLIAIRALAAFTVWTGTQMLVFNPLKEVEGGDPIPADEAEVPAKLAHDYVAAGIAEYVDPADALPPPPEPELLLVPDPDTVIGGGEPPATDVTPDDDDADHDDAEFTMTHLGRGKYEIVGPGIDDKAVIQGKADALAYIAGIKAALANAPVD